MTESWARLRAEAPDFAKSIEARLNANLHHVLGTIRPDGSPRLSGTEISISPTELGLGMMPECHKLADIRRDPRIEVHTAPLDTELKEPDIKLSGSLRPNGEVEREADDEVDGPAGFLFIIDIERASSVRVDGDELGFCIWTPAGGLRISRRS
jgi:hypothetical protein